MRNDWELRSDQAALPTPPPPPPLHVMCFFSHSVCVRPAFSREGKPIALRIHHLFFLLVFFLPHPSLPLAPRCPGSCLLSLASRLVAPSPNPPVCLSRSRCVRDVALRCVCVSLSLDSLLVYSAAYILPLQVPRVLLASQTLGTCS